MARFAVTAVFEDDPGNGGLARVREPRRPRPGPGHLPALDEPGPVVDRHQP